MRLLASFILFAIVSAPAAELAITEPVFRAFEEGPPLSPPVFGAGVPVYLSFRINGFAAAGEDKNVDLAYTINATDPSKRPLAEPATGEVKVEISPEDKDWTPKIRYEVQLPAVPEPGTYTVEISVEDRIAKKTARLTPTFTVEGQKLPDSSSLGVRNFRFLHGENDITGTETGAVYHAGDVLWARFDISGYKFGPKNRYSIRYGLSLKAPDGKVIFEQPKAAADSDEGFYPRLFISATFSVNLGKDIKAGDYSLVVTVTDEIANQTAEGAFGFTVQ